MLWGPLDLAISKDVLVSRSSLGAFGVLLLGVSYVRFFLRSLYEPSSWILVCHFEQL